MTDEPNSPDTPDVDATPDAKAAEKPADKRLEQAADDDAPIAGDADDAAPEAGEGDEPTAAKAAKPVKMKERPEKKEEKPAKEAEPDFPDDWRQKLAGDDKKFLKRLERYTSPHAFAKAYQALEQRLRSGEFVKKLPADASEEEKAEWREMMGIPRKPDGYKLELSDGLVVGEADKPIVDDFIAHVHAKDAPPEVVNAAVEWYFQNLEKQQEALAAADKQFKAEAEDELRTEWGNNYRGEINRVFAMLETAPPGLKEDLLGARLANGRLLGDDPNALRALAGWAREINPAATVVPANGGDVMGSVEEEIAKYQPMLGDYKSAYHKQDAEGDRLRKRYIELIDAREKLKKRA